MAKHERPDLFQYPRRTTVVSANNVEEAKLRFAFDHGLRPDRIVTIHAEGFDRSSAQTVFRIVYEVRGAA